MSGVDLGDTSTFSVSRIDMRTTKVIANVQKRLARRRSGEEVLGAVGEAVAALYKDRPLRAGEQRGVAPEVARWLNPPPLPRWVFFTTAGAAAVAARGAPRTRSPRTRAGKDYNALASGGGTVSGAELVRLKDQRTGRRTTAPSSSAPRGCSPSPPVSRCSSPTGTTTGQR